jgi:hypothetical protein
MKSTATWSTRSAAASNLGFIEHQPIAEQCIESFAVGVLAFEQGLGKLKERARNLGGYFDGEFPEWIVLIQVGLGVAKVTRLEMPTDLRSALTRELSFLKGNEFERGGAVLAF